MAKEKSIEELMLEAEQQAPTPEQQAQASAPEASLPDVGKRGKRGKCDAPVISDEPAKPNRLKKTVGVFKQPKVALGALAIVVVVAVGIFALSRYLYSQSTDIWDGTANTDWYHEGVTAVTINTAEELAGMRQLCNEGVQLEGINFTLARNLDLYDIPTKPIGDGRQDGTLYHEFHGSFDGKGHTISGINIEEDMWDHAGLFGSAAGGDIKNLTVDGKVTGQVRVGGIVGQMEGGSLQNCMNYCEVSSLKTATSYYPVTADVGGVCGIWLGITSDPNATAFSITDLTNGGDVSARACSVGGVIGSIANTDDVTLTISNLVNNAPVTVFCESDERDEAVGGVVGVIGSLGTTRVSGFTNNGEVSCSTVLSVGGVFGAVMAPQQESGDSLTAKGIRVTDCRNTARVAANADDERAHLGGLVGYLDDPDVTFEGCENTGELAATNGNADDICAINGAEVWDEWEEQHPASYV